MPTRLIVFCVGVLFVGCAQTLTFNECSTDADCAAIASGSFCTQEHFCVTDTVCPTKITTTGTGTPLVIASLVNRSDPFDQHIEYATVIAVNEINMQQSGANQPPIELHLCDQGTKTEDALVAMQHAVERYHAVAIVGPTASDALIGITSYLVAHQVIAVSPSATSVTITGLTDEDFVWRTAPSDALQGVVLAKLVNTQSAPAPSEIDAVWINSVYGQGLATTFLTTFDKLSMVQVDLSLSFMPGTDPTSVIGQINDKVPSDLLAIADVDAPNLLTVIGAQPKLAMTRIYMTDSAKTTDLFTNNPKSVLERVLLTAPATPRGATYDAFRHVYMSSPITHGDDPNDWGFDANAYDATYVVALGAAMKPGGGSTGADIVRALKTLNQSGDEFQIGIDAYDDAVKKMQNNTLRLLGASGPLDFDVGTGDVRNALFDVWHVTFDPSTMAPNGFASVPPPM